MGKFVISSGRTRAIRGRGGIHDFECSDTPKPPPEKKSDEGDAVEDSDDQKGQPSKDG